MFKKMISLLTALTVLIATPVFAQEAGTDTKAKATPDAQAKASANGSSAASEDKQAEADQGGTAQESEKKEGLIKRRTKGGFLVE